MGNRLWLRPGALPYLRRGACTERAAVMCCIAAAVCILLLGLHRALKHLIDYPQAGAVSVDVNN
jgi:hypothetical protein